MSPENILTKVIASLVFGETWWIARCPLVTRGFFRARRAQVPDHAHRFDALSGRFRIKTIILALHTVFDGPRKQAYLARDGAVW